MFQYDLCIFEVKEEVANFLKKQNNLLEKKKQKPSFDHEASYNMTMYLTNSAKAFLSLPIAIFILYHQ